jgi:hypothetical protein
MLRFIKRLLNGVEENNKFLQLVKRSDGRIWADSTETGAFDQICSFRSLQGHTHLIEPCFQDFGLIEKKSSGELK